MNCKDCGSTEDTTRYSTANGMILDVFCRKCATKYPLYQPVIKHTQNCGNCSTGLGVCCRTRNHS